MNIETFNQDSNRDFCTQPDRKIKQKNRLNQPRSITAVFLFSFFGLKLEFNSDFCLAWMAGTKKFTDQNRKKKKNMERKR